MTTHTSATAQEETPHETQLTLVKISDATRHSAESVLSDRSIDPQWRTIIRAALDLNDPSLAELVSRAKAGEDIADTFESLRTLDTNEDESPAIKTDNLVEIICRAGTEPMAALFMLMGTLENSPDSKELANTVKRLVYKSLPRVKPLRSGQQTNGS